MDVRPYATLGGVLRQHRMRAGYTLQALGGRLCVSSGYLSRVENGLVRLSPEQLDRICQELSIPKPLVQELFRELGQLPPRVVEHLLQNPEVWAALP